MKKCIHCGAELSDDAKACNNCGWPVGKPDTISGSSPEIPRGSSETPSEERSAGTDAEVNKSGDTKAPAALETTADQEKIAGASGTADFPGVEDVVHKDQNVTSAATDSETAKTEAGVREDQNMASAANDSEMVKTEAGVREDQNVASAATDSETAKTEAGTQEEQKIARAAADHGVIWDKDDSKDKIDIPWDPEKADRKKAEARNGGGDGGFGNAESSGDHTDVFRNRNGEEHSDQPGGYWFQGKWHPISDLNSGESSNRERTGSGNGRYWENGAWHDGPSAGNWKNNRDSSENSENAGGWNGSDSNGGNSGNGWNSGNADSGWKNGQNTGWNSGNANSGWSNGQNTGWNSSNSNGGWSGNQGNAPYGSGYGPGYPIRNNSFAVAAMVLAVISIFLNSLYCIPSVLGIFFAIVALNQIRKNPGAYRGRGMAIAALIMCIVLFIVYLIAFVEVFRLMRDPAFMKQIEDYLKQLQGTVSSSAGQAAAMFRV
ncbi:DUF4190 domain-containing protein [Bilifractor sp. LCP19S3_H10]|uniref:DUF4190 domain-containing protein n=1 Tax=Bilifractor sp. LCP19S3_H10 TaxID=3438736 RepID=UPI003F9176B7